MSAPVNHDVLDSIWSQLLATYHPRRQSECVEFQDRETGQWYEIVVRPIDQPSDPTPVNWDEFKAAPGM